jgi:hypothetical protein
MNRCLEGEKPREAHLFEAAGYCEKRRRKAKMEAALRFHLLDVIPQFVPNFSQFRGLCWLAPE